MLMVLFAQAFYIEMPVDLGRLWFAVAHYPLQVHQIAGPQRAESMTQHPAAAWHMGFFKSPRNLPGKPPPAVVNGHVLHYSCGRVCS